MAASGRRVSEIAEGFGRWAFGAGVVGPAVLAVVLGGGPLVLAVLGPFVLAMHVGASLVRAWRVARVLCVLPIIALAIAPFVVMGGDSSIELVATIANVVLPLHVALQTSRVARVLERGRVPQGQALGLPFGLGLPLALIAVAGVVAMMAGPRAPLALRGFMFADDVTRASPVVGGLVVVAVVVVAFTSRSVVATLAYVVAGATWGLPLALGTAIDPQQALAGTNAFLIAHGAQLVWLTLFVESRSARQRERTFDPLAFVAVALVVGAFVVVDVPWVASRIAGVDVLTALIVVQATMSLAHAVIDAFVFRLSAPDVVAALAPDARPAQNGRANISNARAIAFVVPGTLIVAGLVVDVLQGWLTRQAASERDLLRAEALHPYDARVLLPRAVRALAHDDKDPARATLGAIAQARAFSPETERARLLLCALELERDAPMSNGDVLPASACVDPPAYLEDDAEVLALTSRAAFARGDVSRAKRLAQRAVERAPDDPRALAALGVVEAHLTEATAIAHLERALELSRARIGNRDPLVTDPAALDVGVALARAYDTQGDHKKAGDIAARTLEGATNADRPRHAMRALLVQGHALEDGGDARAALAAYLRALKIASFAASPADEAWAWIDYGSLLVRSAAGDEPAYACAAKARALVDALHQRHPDRARLLEITSTRMQNLEVTTPPDAQARVRADVDGSALATLSFAYPDEGEHEHED